MRPRTPLRQAIRFGFLALSAVVFGSSAAFAQATVAGVVKDASGAVLPGVTVEAASPVLIEKVRTGITDGAGQYRITDLRPGTYDVSFSLTGFSTVKREGIVLSGTATANVNAELKVGAVAETVTVTGASPLVDVQGVATERSIGRELLESVPSSRTIHNVATLIPGLINQGGSANPNVGDVGGSALGFTPQASIHGGNPSDQRQFIDGLSIVAEAGIQVTDFQVNMASVQELNVDTAGMSAEDYAGGVRLNIVPREGSNQFHTSFFADYSGPSLESSNYTDDLKARGYPQPNPVKPLQRAYNVNPAVGGPLKKDKLWFFVAANRTRNATYVAVFPNRNVGNPNAWLYTPDPNGTFPTIDIQFWGENGRLTWQATPKNKLAFYFDTQVRCSCPQGGASQAPEAQPARSLPVSRLAMVTYTAPLSNRVVVDFAALNRYEPAFTTGALHLDSALIPVNDTGLGFQYRNYFNETGGGNSKNNSVRGSVSLISGSHALKAGFNALQTSTSPYNDMGPNEVRYTFSNGVPNQVTIFADPRVFTTYSSEAGVFVQDRWTMKRLTLTGGLRYDGYWTSFPEQFAGPTLMTPTRNLTFPATDGASIQDITPRMGASIDIFGNGRTAVKASLNKYLAAMNTGSGNNDYNFGIRLNPANRIATSANRSWNDANKNFVPDCVLSQLSANGECGAMSNQSFGLPVASTNFDPEIVNSWNKRLYNWEFTTGVQQQVLDRLAVEFTYFRRKYGDMIVTDNRAVAPSDFTQFSIVAPVDPRLPGGGGYTISGLYDVSPAKFGLTNDLTAPDWKYGDVTRGWQGFDALASVRSLHGLTFQGGFSSGSTFQDMCDIKKALPGYTRGLSTPFLATSPTDPWCAWSTKWLTQFKGMGTYVVPKIDVQAAVGIQSMPGPQIYAYYNAPNSAIIPSLGRPLAGGTPNARVNLIEPGTLYGERMNTVDLRLGKVFRFAGRGKVSANVDLFNMFNASTVLIQNDSYSPTTTAWQTPQTVIAPRVIKFGVQFDF